MIAILLLALSLAAGALASGLPHAHSKRRACEDCGEPQFISYNGTLTGTVSITRGISVVDAGVVPCTYSIPPIDDADIDIGINGPWDPNKMFFHLTQPRMCSWNTYMGCTHSNAVYELEFWSSFWDLPQGWNHGDSFGLGGGVRRTVDLSRNESFSVIDVGRPPSLESSN
ncbi:hypothetical protein Micbo1qcDRAFT_208504 [Microdochium bolleyi]|uniref:Uncharacterized protein n=1 Tax=Microdochium bolleyi TaxID=196109 RepID=A0A136IQA8_9PEZI|nr:hypothetical protein Micbo1qcDRAFT_208504 [Microdochium bolleyi]